MRWILWRWWRRLLFASELKSLLQVLHADADTNVVWSGTFDWGDVDGALKAADRVIRIKELHFDRFSSTPLECSAALVEYDRGTEQFTIR